MNRTGWHSRKSEPVQEEDKIMTVHFLLVLLALICVAFSFQWPALEKVAIILLGIAMLLPH